MAGITLTNTQVSKLYKAKFDIYCFLALNCDRTDPTNPAQSLNADTFQLNWKIENADLAQELVKLEKADLLKYAIATFTVRWDKVRSSPFTQDQLLERFKDGIDQAKGLIYDALLIDKASSAPLGVTQPVTTEAFCSRWKITKEVLFGGLAQLQARQLLTLDLSDASITWLL